jgi:PAS domain S-box-containing protein
MPDALRVLLVEDSPGDALLLQLELRRGGFEPILERVETEETLKAALARGPWDLIVLDYGLPTFGAERALEIIREEGLEVPVIVVSGTVPEVDLINAMRSGASDYIQKDNLVRLAPAIRRELAEREARRRSGEALRSREEQFRFVIENTSDLILVLDATGTVTYESPALARLLGHPAGTFLGRSAAALLVPEEQPRLAAALGEAVRQEGQVTLAETHALHRDGSARVVETVIRRGHDEYGQPSYVLSVRDITDRHNLEAQLRQVQKIEAVGLLAGGIAHDFNNLITAILGYGSLMQRSMDERHPLRRNLDGIMHAATRAASLTQQLLAFSRKQLLQPRVLDVAEVIEISRSFIQRLIGEDIQLVTSTPIHLGRVKADPTQIEQVLLNLAINARDAMPRGGRLALEAANADLDEAYARDHISVRPGRYVMFSVSDTGHGMDRDTQARVFEPFFTTKKLGKGTGLGLSTVYGIVKQSGGYIWIYSELGQGTTFKVYLPRVDEAPEARDAQEPEPVSARGDETILLVEDEQGVRELVADLLSAVGYTVLEAELPEKALELSRSHAGSIHLLISDVVMPQMTGPELSVKLRQSRPDLKLLFLSGYSAGFVADRAALPEGSHFLQKPFTAQALERTTRQVLDASA